MAKKPASKRKPAAKKIVRGGRISKKQGFKSPMGVVVVVFVAALGLYTLLQSNALSGGKQLADQPARGLVYNGHKVDSTGPCEGAIETDDHGEDGKGHECTHPDPGPEGVDIRARDKMVEGELTTQVNYDKQHPAKNAGETPPEPILTGGADASYANSLNQVSPIHWPCTGSGSDGYRVQMIYAYQSGYANRGSTLRPFFEGIAQRVNAVTYNSGVASGAPRQVRFMTSTSCQLTISPAAIYGDINNRDNVRNQLRSMGFSSSARKYMVEIDGGYQCGWGDMWSDTRPTQDNYNNNGNMFAFSWHPCWNYEEPHELMHTLGAVQTGAPYSTGATHCYDQHDIMCYQDTSGHAMSLICTSSTYLWRFDCRNDTYFKASAAPGWLGTHWNTANSRFLNPY